MALSLSVTYLESRSIDLWNQAKEGQKVSPVGLYMLCQIKFFKPVKYTSSFQLRNSFKISFNLKDIPIMQGYYDVSLHLHILKTSKSKRPKFGSSLREIQTSPPGGPPPPFHPHSTLMRVFQSKLTQRFLLDIF